MNAWSRLSVSLTYSDNFRAVVVKDGFNFQLLSADSRIRQSEINEEVLSNNYLQWLTNTDSLKMRLSRNKYDKMLCGIAESVQEHRCHSTFPHRELMRD